MAVSVAISENISGSVKTIKWTCTTAADGTLTGATTTTTNTYSGKLLAFATDPGTPAPTDNYDLTILDADGFDVLHGAGANRDTANTEYVAEASLGAINGTLQLVAANAGDSKVFVVKLWIR